MCFSMKVKFVLSVISSFLLLTIFSSCDPEPEETFPIAYEYNGLSFSPTRWFVLTPDAQNELTQVPIAAFYDAEMKTFLEEAILSDFPFQKMEFLTESTVKLTFSNGIQTFDSVFTYTKAQEITRIHLGSTPEEDVVFYNGAAPHTLHFGVISTYYSYKLSNGSVDYSPIESNHSTELDAIKIVNDLRLAENLESGDTVAVNIAAFVFK